MKKKMKRPRLDSGSGRRLCLLLVLAAMITIEVAAASICWAQEAPKRFAFVGAQYLITAEVSGAHQFILNFVNLSEYVIVVQAGDFIYKGTSGQFYIGQVFDQPTRETRGNVYRYSASILLNSASFKGLNVVGAFHEQASL